MAAPPDGLAAIPSSFLPSIVAVLPVILQIVQPYKEIPEIDGKDFETIEEYIRYWGGAPIEVDDEVEVEMEEDEDSMLLLLEQLELPGLKAEYEKSKNTEDIVMLCRRLLDEGGTLLIEEATIFLGFYGVEINGDM